AAEGPGDDDASGGDDDAGGGEEDTRTRTPIVRRLPAGGGPRAEGTGGGSGAPSAPAPLRSTGASSGSFIGRMASAPGETSFRGLRRVELYLQAGGQAPDLAYREEVQVGPGGQFAVEPLEVLDLPPAAMGAQLFLALQKAREGFVHRHRD